MVKGYCGTKWARVADVFANNFGNFGEQGAGFSLYHQGELVVNIWAGQFDNRLENLTNATWDEHTCVNIFSAGKGLVALCVLRLIADGRLALDAPVADYWPEFSAAAKGEITVRQVLCHRSGLSAFHPLMSYDAIFDWELMVQAIAAETPWWPPNTAQGYSPFIFGVLLGELVKRVSGSRSFDDYFQREIAEPLGLRCYFGVPEQYLSSLSDNGPLQVSLSAANTAATKIDVMSTATAHTSDNANSFALGKLMKANPRGVTHRAFANPLSLMTSANSIEWRQAQIPAANAHANATALATIYGLLASGELLPADYLPLCWQEQSFGDDQVLGLPLRFSLGFMLSQPARRDCRFGRGARAFGHPGAGGSLGFADPDYQLGFGYVTNRMGQSLLIDERATQLIDAIYTVLENE